MIPRTSPPMAGVMRRQGLCAAALTLLLTVVGAADTLASVLTPPVQVHTASLKTLPLSSPRHVSNLGIDKAQKVARQDFSAQKGRPRSIPSVREPHSHTPHTLPHTRSHTHAHMQSDTKPTLSTKHKTLYLCVSLAFAYATYGS